MRAKEPNNASTPRMKVGSPNAILRGEFLSGHVVVIKAPRILSRIPRIPRATPCPNKDMNPSLCSFLRASADTNRINPAHTPIIAV